MKTEPYPTARQMPNGATVADWLGTAKTAAEVAALLIDRVRNGANTMPVETLDRAERELEQALDELRAVRNEVQS